MRLTAILRRRGFDSEAALKVIPAASGGAPYREWTTKVIRLVRHGCANRPFFHIAVQEAVEQVEGNVIEQLGVYDPFPNENNEKIVALNIVRIQHWLDKGACISSPIARLLGLSGYYPVQPKSFQLAWVQRKLLMDTVAELEAAASSKTNDSPSDPPSQS